MDKLVALWRVATSWYVSIPVVVTAGIVIGYFVFFDVYPGRPKIGVIDIPTTVLTEDSAFVISAFLDFARREDDIKAVVIRLNSPGSRGFAVADKLYLETRQLREEKPVVIAVGNFAASGGYLWSLGASYVYATPGSVVGSVGAFIAFPFPSLPEVPDENVIRTGPSKFLGGTRRDFVRLLDQANEAFYQMVVAERGDKLNISREELLRAGIYLGGEGVRLGLVDAIGGESDAIDKAAELAGISNYELVDVNTEVFRIFIQKFRRIFEDSSGGGTTLSAADLSALMALSRGTGDSADLLGGVASMDMLRRLFLPSGIDDTDPEINIPRIDYYYVGPSQ